VFSGCGVWGLAADNTGSLWLSLSNLIRDRDVSFDASAVLCSEGFPRSSATAYAADEPEAPVGAGAAAGKAFSAFRPAGCMSTGSRFPAGSSFSHDRGDLDGNTRALGEIGSAFQEPVVCQ
jgi:hypothetical protein